MFELGKIAPKEHLRIKGVKPIRPAIRWNKLFTQYHVVNRSPEAENWLLILMFYHSQGLMTFTGIMITDIYKRVVTLIKFC